VASVTAPERGPVSAASHAPLLVMRGIHKHFGGVHALQDVSFDLLEGEVHALVGENGAGKSTLVKILAGAYQPDAGEIVIRGRHHRSLTPGLAQTLGVAVIHQEFNLVPWMSAVDNIFLGRELRGRLGALDRRGMRARARDLLARLGAELDPETEVSALSVAQQQLVEIARALAFDAKILVMDEPSAVLGGEGLDRLFQVVRTLRDHGVAVVYISHRLVEIFALASRVTVLKDGRVVGTRRVADVSSAELVRMMVGRNFETAAGAAPATRGEVLLQVRDLRLRPNSPPLTLHLRAGEIVGLAGLVGSGRTSLARALAGVEPPAGGIIEHRGRQVRLRTPRDAILQGIVLVPEDRKSQGLLLPLSVERNIGLPALNSQSAGGIVNRRRERARAATAVQRFDLRPPDTRATVNLLSGGNQQKVVLAKWLLTDPEIVILDEPTRGVDVGAKFEIHRIVSALAARGAAVLLISSELPEVLALSDRVLVMRDGGIVGELVRADATEEAIMHLAVGHEDHSGGTGSGQ
jgi:ABC-type sugar transport system ATPase subunit